LHQKWVIGCATLALVSAFAFPVSASAQSGGLPAGGGEAPIGDAGAATTDPTFYDLPFGARDLRLGMAGTDVLTLNTVLRGLAHGTPADPTFAELTDGAVRRVQAQAALGASGVVNKPTRKVLASQMPSSRASWYGPGLYGNVTACGQTLRKSTVGVAHKKLPCGTKVAIAYRGRWARATVIDRGPFIAGRKWDLTYQLAARLGTIEAGTAKVKAVAAP
jgi:3D (Asp-Asp-Asp) domain-containing protein